MNEQRRRPIAEDAPRMHRECATDRPAFFWTLSEAHGDVFADPRKENEEQVVQSLPAAQQLCSDRLHRIEAFGLSDVGRAREQNEDCFAVLPHLGLFMVTDGMGGHAGGEIASRMAVDSVREVLEDPDATWPLGPAAPCRFPGPTVLVAGVELANARIFADAARKPARRGMGTTFVGALAWGDRMVIAHVGDSRAYRLRGRQLDSITEDHSLVSANMQMEDPMN
jgi:serine/threonine protein phosphatase PrpC